MATDSFRALLKEVVGEVDISELPVPILIATEDLRTKRQVILAEGPFDKVMMAAFALPVYFNPENIGEFRLVDGGATNLVPLKPFEGLFDATVISTTFNNNQIGLYNPLNILNVTIDISKSRRAVAQILAYEPFMIRCDVEEFSFMAFDRGEELIAQGYESCDSRIQELAAYLGKREIRSSPSQGDPSYAAKLERARIRINHAIPFPISQPSWGAKGELLNWRAFRNPHLLYPRFFAGGEFHLAIPHFRTEVHGLYGGQEEWGPMLAVSGDMGSLFTYRLESFWPFRYDEEAEERVESMPNYHFANAELVLPLGVSSITPRFLGEMRGLTSEGWEELLLRGEPSTGCSCRISTSMPGRRSTGTPRRIPKIGVLD